MSKPEAPSTDPNRVTFTDSTNVAGASFDPNTKILTVEFKDKRSYRYSNVTPEMFAEWKTAKSAGKWFAERIKSDPKTYPVIVDAATPPASADASSPPAPTTGTAEASPAAAAAAASSPAPSSDAPVAAQMAPAFLRVDFTKSSKGAQDRARAAYEAYAENAMNLTWDGKPMPVFDKLNNAVRSHWVAAIEEVVTHLQADLDGVRKNADTTQAQLEQLGRDLDDLTARAGRSPAAADLQALRQENATLKADPAVARNAMLESEIHELRLKLANAERDNREQTKLVEALKNDNPGAAAAIAREQAARAKQFGVPVVAGSGSGTPAAPTDKA